MKYRYFILCLLFLLLTGCKFEYNLNITSDAIEEDNIAYIRGASKDNVEEEVYKIVEKYSGPTNELGMYNSSVVNKDGLFGVDFSSTYNYDSYQNSPSFSLCYDSYKIVHDDSNNSIVISTNGDFKCFDMFEELEELTINVATDYNVISSNADKNDNNVYTWYIKRGNIKNKSINIEISAINDSSNNDNNKRDNNGSSKNNDARNSNISIFSQNSAFWVVFAAILFGGFIVLILKFIGKKNNEI